MLRRTRAVCFFALLPALATAAPAGAGPLWQDTVFGGGPDGQANAVVSDGLRACAGSFVVPAHDAATGALLWQDLPGAVGPVNVGITR